MNRLTKVVSSLLCTAMLLTACSGGGEKVMTYGSRSITESELSYYLATYKGYFIENYSDVSDTDEFYDSEYLDGKTGEEYLFDLTIKNVKLTLICEKLFDDYKLKLPDDTKDEISEYIQSFIDEYAAGDKRALNLKLAEYGINVNMLEEVYINQQEATYLFSYLYGDEGTIGVTDEDRTEYYEDNYVRFRHIYVNNKYYYPVDEETGYTKTDSNGKYVREEMTGEMLEEKNAVIAEIDAALASGEDFDTVYETYSEDQYYTNGYYITAVTDFVEEVQDAAAELEVGEWCKVESDYGTHYIMRLALDEKPWENEDNSDFFDDFEDDVKNYEFSSYIEQYIDDVEVDEDLLSQYSIKESASNTRF